MLALPGRAEEIGAIVDGLDLESIQQSADELDSGISVKETVLAIISGETRLDADFLKDTWEMVNGKVFGRVRQVAAAFLMPLMAAAVFRRLSTRDRDMGNMVCACACTGIFIKIMTDSTSAARQLITGIAELTEAAVPVLTGLSALGGGTASAALLTPAATLAGEMIVRALSEWGLALCGAAAICACATAIGPGFRLDGLFSLLRRTVQVGAGLMLALFAGILKVQGMLGASFDSAAVKTARFAVDKLVPAVGGGIADTMDAAISSVMLIKNAVGVTGMLVTVAACAAPILQLGATLFAMRLARAVAQPVVDNALLDAVERFCDVIRLLIVLCMAAMTLGLILAGAAIGAGRSIAG